MSSRLSSELPRLHDLLTASVREARQFVLELRSPPVTADQFLPWLRAYTDDFSRENGIRVEMRVEGEGDLPQAQAEEATRLVREALTNVRKHARAASVRIVVTFSAHTTSISVSDDGVGFDVRSKMEELMDSSHNGLIGIRYRAESVGGEMRLRSEVGKGTTLLFRLPRPERRGIGEDQRRHTPSPSSVLRDEGPAPAPSQRDTSVRDSIRATLAEALDSFLEQEGEESAARGRRDSEV
jgi:signal transduction histidine kinase